MCTPYFQPKHRHCAVAIRNQDVLRPQVLVHDALRMKGLKPSEESEDDDTVLGFNGPLSPAERAEAEDFGRDYAGPKMTESESARLMVLMAHASTCPGR